MLKTNVSKIKVRVKDIKQGKTFYVAHPFFGIERIRIKSKPFQHSDIGLFVYVYCDYDPEYYRSLRDMGICEGETWNSRRTFVKLKQAVDYIASMKLDPATIKYHNDHMESCSEWFN